MLSATIYAKNSAAMVAFYSELLPVEPVDQGETFCTLQGNGLTLTIVQIPQEIASTFEISTPPEPREDAAIKLSFVVPDLERARAIVTVHGGVSDPGATVWEWQGVSHVNVVDLEGNVLELTSAKG